MKVEIKVPSPGESIVEVQLAGWLVADGEHVDENQEIVEIDSDKATLSISATASGQIKILVEDGDTIAVNSIIAEIDTSLSGKVIQKPKEVVSTEDEKTVVKDNAENKKLPKAKAELSDLELNISPLARKLMNANDINDSNILEFFKQHRVNKQDVEYYIMDGGIKSDESTYPIKSVWTGERTSKRVKMSMLRKKLARRLVSVKSETAMLTTFNEVNMSSIMAIRKNYKEAFSKHHNINLGFMSFFTKAVTEAMTLFPQINSQITGDEIISFDYVDISVAISAPKGLVVPVIRNAESLSLAQIEQEIKNLAAKARNNKLSLEEMRGGTFTITNGGVFGSMMSTPILNPPQSAILGMHNIVERPVAVDGKVIISPMMYIALSYDHRVVDGRESVGFLVKVKEMLESPERMLFGAKSPVEVLLGI